jgi:2'-5' RNA ligase
MQLRYFIGIALPPEFSHPIARLQRDFFISGRVMEPLVPHITLLHPNILRALAPSSFVPKVKQAAARILPISIELKSTNMFDKRVLYITAEGPGLHKLHSELSNLLPDKVRTQYERERRFVPHVTLMQTKPKQTLPTELINDFKKEIEPLLPQTFTVTSLSQFTRVRPRTYKIANI